MIKIISFVTLAFLYSSMLIAQAPGEPHLDQISSARHCTDVHGNGLVFNYTDANGVPCIAIHYVDGHIIHATDPSIQNPPKPLVPGSDEYNRVNGIIDDFFNPKPPKPPKTDNTNSGEGGTGGVTPPNRDQTTGEEIDADTLEASATANPNGDTEGGSNGSTSSSGGSGGTAGGDNGSVTNAGDGGVSVAGNGSIGPNGPSGNPNGNPDTGPAAPIHTITPTGIPIPPRNPGGPDDDPNGTIAGTSQGENSECEDNVNRAPGIECAVQAGSNSVRFSRSPENGVLGRGAKTRSGKFTRRASKRTRASVTRNRSGNRTRQALREANKVRGQVRTRARR